MKKNIILHIGVHKTGSTAVQHAGELNKDWLRFNKLYWINKQHFLIPFHRLFFYRQDKTLDDLIKQQCKEQFEKILAAITQPTVVLSLEDLSLCYAVNQQALQERFDAQGHYHTNRIDFLHALGQLLQGHQVKIILYVRRQDLFLESLYAQQIKSRNDYSATFDQFIKHYPYKYIDWTQLVDQYEAQFGAGSVDVTVYERDTLLNNDILDDFYTKLGLDKLLVLPAKSAQNQRLAKDYFEKIRAFNTHIKPTAEKQHQRNQNIVLATQLLSSQSYGFFTDQARIQFLQQFEQSNSQLAKKINHSNPQLFKSPQLKSLDIIDQSQHVTLSKKEIAQFKALLFKPIVC